MKIMRYLRIAFWCLFGFLIFALIWWGGPELRLGDSRPLEPVGWRVGLVFLILLIFSVPLLSRALSYLYERLKTIRSEVIIDSHEVACNAFLHQINKRAGRKLFGLAPDYLIFFTSKDLEGLIDKWPSSIAWRTNLDGAGSAFMSGGRVYLLPEPDAWSAWAKLLRWRPGLRGLLSVSDADIWSDQDRLKSALDQLYSQGDLWRRKTGRVLQVWFWVVSPQASGPYSWRPEQSGAPWGVSLPRGSFSETVSQQLAERFLRAFDRSLADPSTAPRQIQFLLQMRARTQHQIFNGIRSIKRASDRGLKARLVIRGLHFVWLDEGQAHGLSGLLAVLFQDKGRTAFSLNWRIGGWVLVGAVFFLILDFAKDSIFFRPLRHERVLQQWSTGIMQLPAVHFLRDSSQKELPDWILAINDLDLLLQDSRIQLGEKLPDSARDLIDRIRTASLHHRIVPSLQKKSTDVFRQLKKSPDERYRHLAFSIMLDTPHRANSDLVRSILSEFDLTQTQINALIDHWMRMPGRLPTQEESINTQWKRSNLRGSENYTVEDMVWRAMREQLRASDAEDFSLDRYMGPNTGWFADAGSVDWFFTHEGVMRGFQAGREQYKKWVDEYRWVMGLKDLEFSLDSQEALELRMRARYVQEATHTWQTWLKNLRLQGVKDLAEAADRAQLFGSEASPLISLIDLLERHMPLPPNGQGSLWARIKTRVATDWARLQYEFGWRRSPKPPVPRTDPRIPIAQNFALLQLYFSNPDGKAPARDRLLTSVKAISDYLGRLNASEQIGSRTPQASALLTMRAQAMRLPSPLREIILSLVETSDQQIRTDGKASLQATLNGVPSYYQCQRALIHPFDIFAKSELPWNEFVEDFGPTGRIADISKSLGALSIPSESRAGSGQMQVLSHTEWLQRAAMIGKSWFPRPGKVLNFRIKPVALSPDIRFVRLLIGDFQWSYAHGQIVETAVDWSPESGVPRIEMEIVALDGEVRKFSYTGAWSLLRWASQARQLSVPDRSKVLLNFDGPKGFFQLLVSVDSVRNPLDLDLYQGMCSAGLGNSRVDSTPASLKAATSVDAELSAESIRKK